MVQPRPPEFSSGTEFDRQLATLLEKDYPGLVGLSADAFAGAVAPLREAAVAHAASLDPPTPARVPFVLVVPRVPAHRTMPLTALRGGLGFADFDPDDLTRFGAIPPVRVPAGPAYLLIDVDRGEKTRNVRPDDALEMITEQGRTPLTIDEGIALITAYPEALEKNSCFWLAGSRCGDRRVPALWISKRAPKLGWCWAGNPHTWLGSASCAGRVAPRHEEIADARAGVTLN